MKKKKVRPFARRLIRSIMWTQFIVMGLASCLLYVLVKDTVKEEELDLYKSYLAISHEEVSQVLSDVRVGMVNRLSEIEGDLDKPDMLSAIMNDIISQNPHIRSCGISFIRDYYPQKGHWFCPYAVRGEDGQVVERNIGDDTHDYLSAEWFREALEKDSCYWSKPFYDSTDSITPLVSYLMPIHNKKGQTVAILGADLSLDRFSEMIMSNEMGNDSIQISFADTTTANNSAKQKWLEERLRDRKWRFITYTFIIDGNGTFIAHPDRDRVIKSNYFVCAELTPDTTDNHVGKKMIAGESGIYHGTDGSPISFHFFDMELLTVYMFYEPIPGTDWSIALAVPALMVDGFAIVICIAMLLLIALGMLVVRIVGWILINRTTKPLKQLSASAREVARGNFDAPLPQIKHNDEIHQLRDSFEHMQHSLTQYIDELKSTTASKAAIDNELRVAHDIQMGMLPKVFPPYPDRHDIDIFGRLKAAKDVGGDLFDFFIPSATRQTAPSVRQTVSSSASPSELFFCIGDVSGKGVPASLLMAVTRSLFRNISAHVSEPDRIVATLNTMLTEDNDTNMFVTLFVGILNLQDGTLRYCNAGHNAPILITTVSDDSSPLSSMSVSDGLPVRTAPQFLNTDPNLPLGIESNWNFTAQQIVLQPGTTILLYTDGLNEAEDINHQQFGEERMLSVAANFTHSRAPHTAFLVEQMTNAVQAFVGEAEQSDDMTMLAIQYRKS